MKKTLVKSILAVAVLALAASAQAQTVHDCRIHHLNISATRRGATLILRGYYLGFDGRPLLMAYCPDENWPEWASNRDIEVTYPPGFVAYVKDVSIGEVVTVSIATVQQPDRAFFREKRFRF